MTSKRVLVGAAAVLVAAAIVLAVVATRSGGGPSAGWGDPTALPDVRATTSAAAVAPDGTAIVAWGEETQQGFGIRTSARAPGGEWSEPLDVGPSRPWEPRSLRLGVNRRGDVALMFTLQNRGAAVVQAAFRPAGEGWEPPQAISRVSRSLIDPVVALDGTGTATVAWTTFDSSGATVHVARRPAEGPWADPARWDGAAKTWVDQPALAATAGDDTRMLVLSSAARSRNRRTGVTMATIDAGSRWTTLPAPPITGAAGYSTAMTATADGGIAVAWQQARASGRYVLRSSTLAPTGGWTAPVVLAEVADDSGFGEIRAMPAGAGAAVAWAQWGDPWLSVSMRGVLPRADGRSGATVELGDYAVDDVRGAYYTPRGQSVSAAELPPPPPPQSNLVVSGSGTPAAMWAGGEPGRFGGVLSAAVVEGAAWGDAEAIPAAGRWAKPLAIGSAGDIPVAVWASYRNGTGTGTHSLMAADRRP